MANHFHDANGILIVGLDGHNGLHFPFVPMWFTSVNFLHPFALGGNQKTTVLFNGVNTVVNQHVTPDLWPHLGVIPDPLDLLTPLHILMGQQKTWIPRSTVLIEGEPATVCAIGGGWSIDLDCWDFGGLPTSLVFNPGTVETTPSLWDYLQGVVSVVIDVAINWILGKIMPFVAEKVMGAIGGIARSVMSSVSEAMESSFLSALLPEVEEAFEDEVGLLADELCTEVGHPVDVVTGAVVDRAVDVTLPGPIPVHWRRRYASLRARRRTSLGRGGWTHSFDQWVEDRGAAIVFHAEDGRLIRFARPTGPAGTRSRRERLTLRADGEGFQIDQREHRRTLHFTPASPGGRALLRRITDARGNAVTLAYEGDRLVTVTDTAGREIRVQYTPGGRVERLEVWARGALSQWVDHAYHPSGELAKVTDALGHAEAYAYDDEHRMVRTTLKNGASFHYAYDDATGRCVRTWGDGGLHTVDLRADPARRVAYAMGGPAPRVYRWNEQGAVVREETLTGELIKARTYDEDLRPLSLEDGAGQGIRCAYDGEGRVVSMTDPGGRETRWEYDGDLVIRRRSAGGVTETYARDPRGDVIGVDAVKDGAPGFRRSLTLRRDERGRVRGVETPRGEALGLAYDEEHNLVARTVASRGTEAMAYDALGRAVAWTAPSGRVTRMRRDPLGRLSSVEQPGGGTTTMEWDPRGLPAAITDACGRRISVARAGTGGVVSISLADGSTYAIARDGAEQFSGIEDPTGARFVIARDSAGRSFRTRSFHGTVRHDRHDRAGRVSHVLWPDGDIHAFTRDPGGRLIEQRGRDAAVRFERDDGDRVVRATAEHEGAVSKIEPAYDAVGRRVAEAQDAGTLRFVHHEGAVDRVLPDGSVTRFFHDRAGRIAAIEQDGVRVDLDRDADGRLAAVRLDGVTVERTHDPGGRLARQRVKGGEGPALDRAYTYDASGVIQRIDDSRWGAVAYDHDAAVRLRSVRGADHAEAYAYDAAGSLVEATGPGGVTRTAAIEPGNLLVGEAGVRYENDARGRRVAKITLDDRGEPAAVTRYRWDSFDRLREVTLPSGDRLRYAYDALGRRTRRERWAQGAEAPQVTEYLWDGYALAAEIVDGRTARAFVSIGAGLPLLQIEGGEVYLCVTDHVGVPQQLLDRRGRVVWEARLTAWGKVITSRGDGPAPPFRLLGQIADDDAGLTVTAARWFDPDLGRWLTPDPVSTAGGANAFAFNGAPTLVMDPSGLLCISGLEQLLADRGLLPGALSGIDAEADRLLAFDIYNKALDADWAGIFSTSDFTAAEAEALALASNGGILCFPNPFFPDGEWSPYVQGAFEQALLDRDLPVYLLSDPTAFDNLFKPFVDDAGEWALNKRVLFNELVDLTDQGWVNLPGAPDTWAGVALFGILGPPG